MQIRLGTLAEAEQVVQEIGEFIRKETVETLAQRLAGKRDLILIAEEDGQLLGFKIGYELDSETFYSWFGGVSSLARNRGVAQQLLDAQEQWVAEQGYGKLTVKSRNQFPAMLRLLLRNGYLIENFEKTEPLAESRIHFVKHFLN
ncbi:GNAT family N-acetyltransferase [Vibrio fluvialis]|jgi:ribosomal protein S18 acetylase RimI-like enzyme|uniref:GNAT family N-acetyltransferase n=1 Tax=Vibrio fluvialis TaxID=676 RepID=UPI001C9BF77A|nr:GNAT family N-acetyltransferase [Vibrio fluvialis]EKO3967354.1 GNAT family N-acetyltransferase [Vibrio fluvialis]MBY8159858.1 GNAT family N-acetyltransferase [Vibrio fluvialis]MCG6378286.1 GNAT family N-acetyltransferase [Vibrio fluvialis]